MSLRNRLRVILLVLCLLSIEIYIGVLNADEIKEQALLDNQPVAADTITLWYTDDALTDFLNSVALAYYEDTDVHVNLQIVSGFEYLENINSVSIKSGQKPDLFIVGNDLLGKAFMSGLASEVQDVNQILTTDNFCQPALDAVTYEGKFVGYPMYFETCVLLYNATYLEQIAESEVEKEWAENLPEGVEAQPETDSDTENSESQTSEGEEGNTWAENPVFIEQVAERSMELVPQTIDEILDFADQYDAPEHVDAIFEWDVSDIFYNYFFVGNYLNVGGQAGDNPELLDIYNENTIKCLNIYQELNQFFSIDAEQVSYETVVQDFIEGKTIFTLVTSDAIATLEQAKADGTFVYDYGVSLIPDLTEELQAKEVSYTNAIAINGYSTQKARANHLARYLCYNHSNSLYDRTGKIAADRTVNYENGAVEVMLDAYALTVPMPKAIETSNFWIELELCFTNVWLGDDANATLKALSEKMMEQITGEEYVEEYIEVIEEEEEIDEDTGMEADDAQENADVSVEESSGENSTDSE